MPKILRDLQFFYFTYFSWFVFSIKLILDDVIGSLLGFLLAAQLVGDFNGIRKAYIICIIVVIVMIFLDKSVRNGSKTFDLLHTLISPINTGTGMNKVINYNAKCHALMISFLILVEIIKILAAVYCIIALAIEVVDGVFLNYVLLGILTVNSLLAFVLYTTLFFHILLIDRFYEKWLIWFAEWYLQCIITVIISSVNNKLTMRFEELP